MEVIDAHRLERLFRIAVGLEIDESDVRRVGELLDDKIGGLLMRAAANAQAAGDDVIEPWHLPITKGMEDSILRFRLLDETRKFGPVLESLPDAPLELTAETRDYLDLVAGGLTLALGRAFLVLDPVIKTPQTGHWERCFRLFDLLV